jgi:hypothetical protein
MLGRDSLHFLATAEKDTTEKEECIKLGLSAFSQMQMNVQHLRSRIQDETERDTVRIAGVLERVTKKRDQITRGIEHVTFQIVVNESIADALAAIHAAFHGVVVLCYGTKTGYAAYRYLRKVLIHAPGHVMDEQHRQSSTGSNDRAERYLPANMGFTVLDRLDDIPFGTRAVLVENAHNDIDETIEAAQKAIQEHYIECVVVALEWDDFDPNDPTVYTVQL